MFNPEPSLPPPCYAEPQFEPTADGEPMPAAINEPSPRTAMSDQVCKLAARHATVEVSIANVESPAHCTTARDELRLHSEDVDIYTDMPCLLLPSSSVCSVTTTEVVIELSVYIKLSVCLELCLP